ncbi:hypothetical protein D3C85_1229780 [compost metagenome]
MEVERVSDVVSVMGGDSCWVFIGFICCKFEVAVFSKGYLSRLKCWVENWFAPKSPVKRGRF